MDTIPSDDAGAGAASSLSPTAFLDAVRPLFKVLRQQGSSWRARVDGGLVVAAPALYLRALVALRECCVSAGHAGMQALAEALLAVLEQLRQDDSGLDAAELDVVERAIAALGAMPDDYAAGRRPEAPPPSLADLAALARRLQHPVADRGDGAQQPRSGAGPVRAAQDEIDAELLPVFLDEGHELMIAVGEGLQQFQRKPSDLDILAGLRRPLHTVKGSARMAGAMRLGQCVHELESAIQRLLGGQEGGAGIEALLVLYDRALERFEALEQFIPASRTTQDGERLPATSQVRIRAAVLDRLLNQVGEVSITRSQLENEVAALQSDARALGRQIAGLSSLLRQMMGAEAMADAAPTATQEEGAAPPCTLATTMAARLEDAASLHKRLLESAATAQENLLLQGRLTRDLQQELMYARMVKFSSIEQRMQHLARQVAAETGKPLTLDLSGCGVQIDRAILERLIGPLEHLLRNAAVHGIEDAAARAAAGKPAAGTLAVHAQHEGNEAVIRVSDDGRGLDLAAIRRKALELRIAHAASLNEARLAELIFEPGFTTSPEVSALAGRGMGMDVARSEVAALGGRMSVQSRPGEGVRFIMHLPLSLAVKQICLLRHGGQSYAIPSPLIDSVAQLRGAEMRRALTQGYVTVNDRMLTLHSLHCLLGEPQTFGEPPGGSMYALFIKHGADLMAILVDQVCGNREVAAKPVGPQLATLAGVVGATVLGNGEIVLILNPLQLAGPRRPDGMAAAPGVQ